MAQKGKSQYSFSNCDVQPVEEEIKSFLRKNEFRQLKEIGPNVYQINDRRGIMGFEYCFIENELIIYAYMNSPNNPHKVDGSVLGLTSSINPEYNNQLKLLFCKINEINASKELNTYKDYNGSSAIDIASFGDDEYGYSSCVSSMNANPLSYGNNVSVSQNGQIDMTNSESMKKFIEETDKKNSKLAVVSLVAAIFLLLTACRYPSIIIFQIANIYLVAQGLKSSKKTIAEFALVITIISILLSAFMIFLRLMRFISI